MYIIEIIPLITLPPQVPQLLSYFFNRSLLKGAIVEVLINNRKIQAVVIGSTPLEEQKANLKKSSFQLKKISSVISEEPKISEAQFKTALWLSKNYFTPLGLCLKTVLPPFFFKNNYELQVASYEFKNNPQSAIRNPLILLSRAKDIIKNIEPEIKSVLDKKRQVLLIVSEISTAEYFYDYFAGYYETAIIHSRISSKKYQTHWSKISSGDIEIIIGTRLALFTPFNDLGLIVMEDYSNIAYKSDMSPKYNTEDLARQASNIYSCPLIFVSQVPDIKNYLLIKSGSENFLNKKASIKTKVKILDIVQEIKSGNFSLFSRDLTDKIISYADDNKKTLIFSSRKGYGGLLMCENCNLIFKCPQCSVPLKVYKLPLPTLICHRCSNNQKIPEFCPNCQSYKLKSAGSAGSQKLEEQVRHILEKTQRKKDIFIFDLSVVKNTKTEKEMIKKMEESKSYICIATQLLFSYRYTLKFDLIGVPNLNSLTALPDFRSEEGLFCQFEKMLDFDPEELIIQTFNPDDRIIKWLKENNHQDFYETDMEIRKLLWYPPFARLIKLSFKHLDRNRAEREVRILAEKLKMAILQRKLDRTVKMLGPSPAFVEKEHGAYVYNIILKIVPEQKPEEILRFVPSNWNIDVDPRSIL